MQGLQKEPRNAEVKSEAEGAEVKLTLVQKLDVLDTFGIVPSSRGLGSLEPNQADESKHKSNIYKSPQFQNNSVSDSSTDKNKTRFCHQENQPCPKEINRKIRQISVLKDKTRNVSGGHTTVD